MFVNVQGKKELRREEDLRDAYKGPVLSVLPRKSFA